MKYSKDNIIGLTFRDHWGKSKNLYVNLRIEDDYVYMGYTLNGKHDPSRAEFANTLEKTLSHFNDGSWKIQEKVNEIISDYSIF